QEADGSWQGFVNTTAFAILALRAAGRSADGDAVRRGVEFIADEANDDGGFNFAGSGRPSGADDTGAALMALGAAGKRRSGVARRAVAWLESRQNADGGFSLQGGASNAQSTAWAVQGLIAVGRNPKQVRRGGSRSPVAYLRSLVGSDGAIRYSRTSTQTPVWVTAQAVAALEGKALPLKPVPRARRPKAVATPAPTPAPTATPAAADPAPVVEPADLEADGLGVAEPELRDEDGNRVSVDEVVAQMPSPLEIRFARVVAMPIGVDAGAAGALAAVIARLWRPPAAGV
ncbi:MAG: prenyltransferase/squalene oxidase repeat-containing protein, partial [Solirubrobacteraceae bacterium]